MDSVPSAEGLHKRVGRRLGSALDGVRPGKRAVLTVNLEPSGWRVTASRGRRLVGWTQMPFNPTLFTEDTIADSQQLGQVLHSAVARLDCHPVKVLAAYPGTRALARSLDLPAAARSNIDNIIAREMRQRMGIDTEQTYIFWTHLREQGAMQRYYVVTASRQLLNRYMDTLANARLHPQVVDLKALALARASGLSDVLILNLELSALLVVALLNGAPEVINHVPLADPAVRREEEVLSVLTDETDRALAFLQQRAGGDAPVPFVLTGGHPQVANQGIVAGLEQNTGLSHQQPDPPLLLPADFPLHVYLTNLGLLLRRH